MFSGLVLGARPWHTFVPTLNPPSPPRLTEDPPRPSLRRDLGAHAPNPSFRGHWHCPAWHRRRQTSHTRPPAFWQSPSTRPKPALAAGNASFSGLPLGPRRGPPGQEIL